MTLVFDGAEVGGGEEYRWSSCDVLAWVGVIGDTSSSATSSACGVDGAPVAVVTVVVAEFDVGGTVSACGVERCPLTMEGGFGFGDRTFEVTPFTSVPVPVSVTPLFPELEDASNDPDPFVKGPSRFVEFLPYSR